MLLNPNEIIKSYSVLPQLHKLSGSIFVKDENYDFYLELKKKAIQNQICFVEHNFNLYDPIINFIQKQYPINLNSFEEISLNIQEDLVIHCLNPYADWFGAGHICFPSGWRPEEKIGKSFQEIHSPVPGIKVNRKLVESLVNYGPFERYVWGVIFEETINGHPNYLRKEFKDKFWIKIERQVVVGFPEHSIFLFVIRQHLFKEEEIDKKILFNSLSKMNDMEKEYKGINKDFLESLK